MIAEYEAGLAPDCSDCRSMMECQYSAAACTPVIAGNHLLGLCYESACVIAKIHDQEKRRYIAAALVDAWPDILPERWFEASEFLEACGVERQAVAA